jgi:hypothetical protein
MFKPKAHPLSQFLQKVTPTPMEDEPSKHAFEQFKLKFQATPILWPPNWNKPFLIYSDASRKVMGSTLSQLEENGHDHPIHFASRQLISTKNNNIVTKLKSLVVIFSLKKFRHYLLGYRAKIVKFNPSD